MTGSITLLGSTGSIGTQTLDVCAAHDIPVVALAAGKNGKLMESQARRHRPKIVALQDESAARDLKTKLADTDVRVVSGESGILEAALTNGAEVTVNALVGVAGLVPTTELVKTGRRLALANKESLVCAGTLVMNAAREHGTQIIPVDSEHSAILQCLLGAGENRPERIILTASGGPFRGMTRAETRDKTAADALRHPNWSMGAKITIDSATLMNKGFELIEAMHLFSLAPQDISVVVHPQSIIHSAVEFVDGAIIAQLGVPDMRTVIQYAITYPARVKTSPSARLKLTEIAALTFEEPDMEAFPCLALAIRVAQSGGVAGAVLNGANEAAVARFLNGEIAFGDIYELTQRAVDTIKGSAAPELEEILAAGREGYAMAAQR